MNEPLEQLVTRLLALTSAEGDAGARRLPPERELCDALGMSRGALREQLAVLERLGFIHRTQGRGTYIDTPSTGFVRSYFTIARELGYLTDEQFLESRVLLEEAVAAAAAVRGSDEDIARLRTDVERMIDSTRAGEHEDAFEADMSFHRHLHRMVGNPVLHLLHDGLSSVMRETLHSRRLASARAEPLDADGLRHTDHLHYAIVQAIEEGDPDSARTAMRQHFDDWLARSGMPPTRD